MAALTASDLTIVVTERWIENKKRVSRGTITMPATLTYTVGGIPLNGPTAALTPPAVKRLGMDRQLDVLIINGDNVGPVLGTATLASYDYKYNTVNKSITLYGTSGTATQL